MGDYSEAFIGIDVAKNRNAIAVAEAGRDGEVRYFGEVDASDSNMRRAIQRIASKYGKAQFCYEAGPTGYGLQRRLLCRIEFHHVSKHASWLNRVEIEIGVLASQCSDRRIESYPRLVAEVAAWKSQRNAVQAQIDWSFTTDKARAKMGRAYPKPTNLKRPHRVKTAVPRY